MDMVEVDPELYMTCRLCLDKEGLYQINTPVQTAIKYLFGIEVEKIDGLSQLLCKKCKTFLKEYDDKKKEFQENQISLKSKLKKNEKDNSLKTYQQQQETVSSTQQADTDCNSFPNVDTKILSNCQTSSAERDSCKENTNVISIKKNVVKKPRSFWQKDYIKHFVCRFCSKSYKEKRSISNHLRQCKLKVKYSNIVQKCFVELYRLSSVSNLTFSNENVVCNKNKIIHCRNKNYYILYTLKSFEKCVSSSDEDFTTTRKHKRRRLISRGSNETLVIEGNISKSSQHSDNEGEETTFHQTKVTDVSDVECIDIDDSDSVSSNLKALSNNEALTKGKSPVKLSLQSEKKLQNVITMCYNKFLKRINARSSNNSRKVDSCLERKILSLGLRVVTSSGLISTGLIRYMEHKDLDVKWIEKKQTNVAVKTSRSDNIDSNCPSWKSLKDLDNSYMPNDFIDYLENIAKKYNKSFKPKNITNSITQSATKEIIDEVKNTANNETNNVKNLKSVLLLKTVEKEKQSMLQKLLNENPVANPKQLPKKNSSQELLSLLKNKHMSSTSELSNSDKNLVGNSDNLSMPIITSTISLASNGDITANEKHITRTTNNHETVFDSKLQSSVPRIKVKSVSELMPENIFNQQKDFVLSGRANNRKANFYNRAQNVFDQNEIIPVRYVGHNMATCSGANSSQQQNNMRLSDFLTNENHSNKFVTPCSNITNNIINPQHYNQTYASNYSHSDINTYPSNLLAPPNSNASSCVISSEHSNISYSNIRNVPSSNKSSNIQPNTNHSQYDMNVKSPNVCFAGSSNKSSCALYLQQPNTNYSQYSMNVTNSNIRVTPSTNAASSISKPQHSKKKCSQYSMNVSTSNICAMPSYSNVTSLPSNTVSVSQYNNYNNYPKNPNIADKPKSKSSSEKQHAEKPSNNEQYVFMDTIELPWKKTNSPFRYFQELLRIHNINLLDSIDVTTNGMSCLIKFKLVFQQEAIPKMTLDLSLFYCNNTFCITLKDLESKILDIAKLSAYWQWEILKEFKGDVVSKLYENASKISPEVLNKTEYFITLLNNIKVKK